jgi:sensor histidine kinase YesM
MGGFKKIRAKLIFHFMLIIGIILFPRLLISFSSIFSSKETETLFLVKHVGDVLCIGYAYISYFFILPYLYKRGIIGRFILISICVFLFHIFLHKFLFDMYLVETFEKIQNQTTFTRTTFIFGIPGPLFITLFFEFLSSTSVATVLFFSQVQKEQREENMKIMLEKQAAELAVLKLQISPHFLFNTLNNLRWMVRKVDVNTEKAIIQLSELLRYIIYQVDKGPVPISKEVEHLENYINLQKMRLSSNTQISINHTIDNPSKEIEPLLLIPFVENAFKFGLHFQLDSHIDIQMSLSNGLLNFRISNPIYYSDMANKVVPDYSKETSSGLGIENVKSRLNLHYPNRHNLAIRNESGMYVVNLSISLL